MSKSREFSITVATVSPDTTSVFRCRILEDFAGFTVNQGEGVYTFQDGRVIAEESLTFTVASSKGTDDDIIIVTEWAKFYCTLAGQESVYFKDDRGFTWLIFANGTRCSL